MAKTKYAKGTVVQYFYSGDDKVIQKYLDSNKNFALAIVRKTTSHGDVSAKFVTGPFAGQVGLFWPEEVRKLRLDTPLK